jgi:8-oxo-dGTP pyrophosphatase MutT (NUDIX family)
MRLPIQIQAIVFRKINDTFEFLLLKRIPEKGGFWQSVTGGLEEGESLETALRREIKEEIGITDIKKIIRNVDFCQFNDKAHENSKGKWLSEFVFGVEIDETAKINTLNNNYKEHSEFKWCSFEEVLKLLKWDSNKESLKKLNKILA